jgi:hypothetical protein
MDALAQVGASPGPPALRGQEIKLQMGLVGALMHTKGHAAPETKASLDQARSLIERAESLGESPADPLLMFSPSSMVCGQRTTLRLRGAWRVNSPRSSWRLLRSSERLSRPWLGIASWVLR